MTSSKSIDLNNVETAFRDLIDFMNDQIGSYVDAMSGFSGNRARILRQVHRYNRPTKRTFKKGVPEIMWTSYEDPTKPDILHHQIIRIDDYLSKNDPLGKNALEQSYAVIIFLFAYWEEDIRPRLARATHKEVRDITCDAFGDLRILRHCILHNKRILTRNDIQRMKSIGHLFPKPGLLKTGYEEVHQIIIACKRDSLHLFLALTGLPEPPDGVEKITSWAIQNPGTENSP